MSIHDPGSLGLLDVGFSGLLYMKGSAISDRAPEAGWETQSRGSFFFFVAAWQSEGRSLHAGPGRGGTAGSPPRRARGSPTAAMRKSRSPAKPGRVLREPPYLMRDVPHCKKDQLMRGKSCVQKVASRREWV